MPTETAQVCDSGENSATFKTNIQGTLNTTGIFVSGETKLNGTITSLSTTDPFTVKGTYHMGQEDGENTLTGNVSLQKGTLTLDEGQKICLGSHCLENKPERNIIEEINKEHIACAAHHGATTACCGFETDEVGEKYVCPSDTPVCEGYIRGSTWGRCAKRMDHEGPFKIGKGLENNTIDGDTKLTGKVTIADDFTIGKANKAGNTDPLQRQDCGYAGIDELDCAARGCKYDDSVNGVAYCFHEVDNTIEGKTLVKGDVKLRGSDKLCIGGGCLENQGSQGKTLDTIMKDNYLCMADHDATKGCCGAEGEDAIENFKCPADRPVCVGYNSGHNYGRCEKARTKFTRSFTMFKDRNFFGGDLQNKINSIDEENCAKRCIQHPECEAFVYEIDTQACSLKKPEYRNELKDLVYHHISGADISGNTIFENAQDNAEKCQAACTANGDCRAVVYNHKNNMCYGKPGRRAIDTAGSKKVSVFIKPDESFPSTSSKIDNLLQRGFSLEHKNGTYTNTNSYLLREQKAANRFT